MATVPLSGTNIRLISGVPFNNDYKNTRWFDTIGQQQSYFLGKPTLYVGASSNFQKIEGSHIVSVPVHVDRLHGANYFMFQNADYNNKWFYAFVTRLEYKNKLNTHVHFEIDVFQTWRFEMKFKPSYVVREHRKLWNADGTPVINTIDEGLNYGTDYDTVSSVQYLPNGGYKWLVIVAKYALHIQDKMVKASVKARRKM